MAGASRTGVRRRAGHVGRAGGGGCAGRQRHRDDRHCRSDLHGRRPLLDGRLHGGCGDGAGPVPSAAGALRPRSFGPRRRRSRRRCRAGFGASTGRSTRPCPISTRASSGSTSSATTRRWCRPFSGTAVLRGCTVMAASRRSWTTSPSTGCVGLDPIEPPPQGDVELRYVREKYGEQMVLFGNLEASDLENLPTPEFEGRIRRAISRGHRGRRSRLRADAIVLPLWPRAVAAGAGELSEDG